MNKRQIIILWIVALALGVAVAVVKFTQKDGSSTAATTRAPGQTLFEAFPATEVATIEVAGADGAVTIQKKDSKWTVAEREDYPAAVSTVNDFLRLLGELKVTRAMEAGPSFAPRFGMDETAKSAADRGLTATFKDATGKEIAKVSLGKNIENAASASPMGGAMAVGRYVRNHADETGFYAVSEMFPSVVSDPIRWLDMDFFSPEKIQSISLSQPDKEDIAWKVVRESEEAEFKLDGATGDEVLDSTAGTAFKSLFAYLRFEDVIPAEKIAERTAETGKRHAVIQTFEGFTYKLTLTPTKSEKPADPAVAAAAGNDQQLLTVSVSAELPKERKKEEGEKPEDAKAKDEAFTTRLKALTEKLEKEKSLEGRTYLVSKSNVDSLLKERAQLIKKAGEAVGEGADPSGVQQLPGGLIAPPPRPPAKDRPVATTPPIEVRAIEPKEKADPKDKEEPAE